MDLEKKILGWKRYEFVVMTCFFFSWGFMFLDRLTISFLAPLVMSDLEITTTQYGLIGTATTAAYAVAAIVVSALVEASGKRKLWLIVFTIATGVFSSLCAITETFAQIIILRGLVGFCEGPIAPLIFAMLLKESSPSKIALNPGMVNMGVTLIAVTFGPIFCTQIAAAYNWRLAFLLASIPTVICGLFMIKVVNKDTVEVSTLETYVTLKRESAWSSFKKLLKHRNIVLCFILAIFTMCGYWTIALYATMFFTSVGGHDIKSAGVIVGLMGVLQIIWIIVVPKISDYIGRKPAVILWFALCATAPFVMFGAPTSLSAIIMYVFVGGIPGSVTVFFQAIIPGETLPNHMVATACGFITGFGEFIGGAIWPAFSGVIASAYGIEYTILVAGIAFATAAGIAFFLKETKGQKVES